jgi:spermidine/putrescine-binding protein
MAAPSLSRRHLLGAAGLIGLAGALDLSLTGCSTAAESRISFLNWQDYVDPELLKRFTDKTGLEVGYETYESNDQLEERLIAASVPRKGGRKSTSFDLIVPSTNLFGRLLDGNALLELDSAMVTSALLGNLDPGFRELPADPGNTFSVPWATGTTGIGYDTTVFAEPPTWEVFLDSAQAGKMSVLNEIREAFAAALFSLGEDPNTTDAAVIEAAEAQLGKFLANAEANSATYLDDLASGKLVVAQGFNTDVLQAAKTNPNLAFTIPPQGGTVWTDLICIPKDAPNPDGANKLIAFYLDPEISAMNAEYNLVNTGNEAAKGFLPASVLDDPAIYPPAEIAGSLVSIANLGDAEDTYAAAWDRLTGG